VDVDTTFTSMNIINDSREVYFMVNGQLSNGHFRLESYDDSKAVFKNANLNNERITLSKDLTNQLSVIVENKSADSKKESKKKKRIIRRLKKVSY